jgi:hypothetical protein
MSLHRFELPPMRIPGTASERIATFIMLNPASKDEAHDGPARRHRTRERCVKFAKGYGWVICRNLFARRAESRETLFRLDGDLIGGPENDAAIVAAARKAITSGGVIVCAWGPGGLYLDRDRAVMRLLDGLPTKALDSAEGPTTVDGAPWHPLARVRDLGYRLTPYDGR